MSKQDSTRNIKEYLHFKKVNNFHTSNNTTRSYRLCLMNWYEFTQISDEQNIDADTLKNVAEKYRNHLVTIKDSIQVKRALNILYDYFEYLKIYPNPFSSIRNKFKVNKNDKAKKKIRRDELVLSEIEIEKMIKIAKDSIPDKIGNIKTYYTAYRNWIMVTMLAKYGMRCEALISINLEDINYQKRRMIIQVSKNKVPYPVPIISMIDDIRDYIRMPRNRLMKSICGTKDNNAMFMNNTGKRLSTQSARKAINSIAKRAGFYESHRSTHQLRHFRATQYRKEGLQPDVISQIMGVSVEVLRSNYFHMTHDDIIREFERWIKNKIEPICPNCGYDQRAGAIKGRRKGPEQIVQRFKRNKFI